MSEDCHKEEWSVCGGWEFHHEHQPLQLREFPPWYRDSGLMFRLMIIVAVIVILLVVR